MLRTNRARILLVEPGQRITGAVRSLGSAVQELKSEFDFTLVGPSDEVREVIGVPLRRFDFALPRKSEVLTFGPRVLWQARKFAKLAAEVGAQLVHVNDLTNIVPLVARWLGGKYGLVYHVRLLPTSYIGPVFRPLTKLILGHADRVLCVSQAVVDSLPKSGRVSLVPNGLPISLVPDGLPARTLLPDPGPPRDGIEVVYVGHFHPGKGHDLAVEALALASKEAPSLRLTFVGSESVAPEFASAIRARVTARGLVERVVFVGPVQETAPYLQHADIVLNLSESESFSMVVLEAMMLGRPIIASRCGGPSELLSDPASGVLVPNRGVGEAAAALIALARDASARRAMGERARAVALERYNVRVTAQLLAKAYRQVLSDAD